MREPVFRQGRVDTPHIMSLKDTREGAGGFSSPFKAIERNELNIPNLNEVDVVRHFISLSIKNFGVDSGIYPLGSCTMKYNPKICDMLASLREWNIHPDAPDEDVQGCLRLMYELQEMLKKIVGLDAVSLQPSAGAQGEFTCMAIARAYFRDRGEDRTDVIVPETAHGTNPASAAMAGFNVIEIPAKDGCTDLDALRSAVSPRTAAFMLTNPNTLGIFEDHAVEISRIIHESGALMYYDGANLNAIMGRTTPGAMGFDMMHMNLHKTFGTPHGGGGPGAGPIAVKKELEAYLPVPVIRYDAERKIYIRDWDRPRSIGKVASYHGDFLVCVRAYAYILMHGGDGLKKVSERAVLNSNYLLARIAGRYELPFRRLRKHEFVVSCERFKERNVTAKDVAKRILDHGVHAPTMYFPHIVKECLMIEPTESESKETLDAYADMLNAIADEAMTNPEALLTAPHNTSVRRVDEVLAARRPILNYRDAVSVAKD
jgi:glycine dehydrogenase subunit 2